MMTNNIPIPFRLRHTGLFGRQDTKGAAFEININQRKMGYLVPVGGIISYAGTTAPAEYLICDGSAVSRNTYYNLFAVIGTTYGSGDGVTTFNLPNLKGKVIVGLEPEDGDFGELNQTGGERRHTLTGTEIPAHTHSGTTSSNGAHIHGVTDPGHSHNYLTVQSQGVAAGLDNAAENDPRPSATTSSSTTGISINSDGAHTHTYTTSSFGGSQSHENLQPYITLNYIIKYI